MRVRVFIGGLNYKTVQTMDPEPGVQNNLTAQEVYYHKNRRSKGVRIDEEGIYDVDKIELTMFGDEFMVILHG